MCKSQSDIYELNSQFLKIGGNPSKWHEMQTILEKMEKIIAEIDSPLVNVQKIMQDRKADLGNLALMCLG